MSASSPPPGPLISFVCQRCSLPVTIHPSFSSIDEHTLAELRLPLYCPVPLDLSAISATATSPGSSSGEGGGGGGEGGGSSSVGVKEKLVPPVSAYSSSSPSSSSSSSSKDKDKDVKGQVGGGGGGGGSGFTVVGSVSWELSPQEGNQLKTHMELFDILSNNTEIDHPLCDECCDTLISMLDAECRDKEEESQQYKEFLQRLENEPENEDVEALEEQLREIKKEEAKLKGELNELKIEEATALENLQKNKAEYNRLRDQEEDFLKEYCRYKRQINEIEDYGVTLDYELQYVDGQLERLEKTNALNATFHIWHSGHFGTINTFRLGRLPSEPVDWNEINAAWGQTALLLNSLAKRISFKFSNYQIVPFGNHSYIKVLADNTELPLHATGGFRVLWDTKFDSGMTAFLDCLSQLQTAMLERPGKSGFALPYKMSDKGKIEDPNTSKSYCVKTQFNSDEQWTKALKFMLTNLKWALAWVSSQTVLESQGQDLVTL